MKDPNDRSNSAVDGDGNKVTDNFLTCMLEEGLKYTYEYQSHWQLSYTHVRGRA